MLHQTVWIIFDHQCYAEGLRVALSSFPNISLIGLSTSGKEAILKMKQIGIGIDVIISELHLKDINVYELYNIVKDTHPHARWILFSDRPDSFPHLIPSSIASILPRSISLKDLVRKIQDETLDANEQSDTIYDRLTSMEIQVMKLIVYEGLTTKEIANRLFISVRTVETHRKHLLRKFDCHTTIDMVRRILLSSMTSPYISAMERFNTFDPR